MTNRAMAIADLAEEIDVSPKVADSLEMLAEILHPSVFQFGHNDTGFQRVGKDTGYADLET